MGTGAEDLHVRSLFLWTVGPLVDDNLKEERLALLNCIRTHFWPGNYDVLLCSYLLDRKVLFDDIKDDMHETMQWWIDTDPTAFWALEQVTSDIDDPRRKVPKLFSDEERWRYLDAAARQLPEGSELGLWIKGKLEETIRAEAGPAV